MRASVLGSIVVLEMCVSCPLGSLMYSICGRSDELVENGDGEEGSEISRGGNRVEIAWPLICRWFGFVW